eukprot:gene7331-11650_t
MDNQFIEDLQLSIYNNFLDGVKELHLKVDCNKQYSLLGCSASGRGYKINAGHKRKLNFYYLEDEDFSLGSSIPWTPIQYASALNRSQILTFFLNQGYNHQTKDSSNKTALEITKQLNKQTTFEILSSFEREFEFKKNLLTTFQFPVEGDCLIHCTKKKK